MAKKSTKSRVNRIVDYALGIALAAVVVTPLAMYAKSKIGV